MKQRITIEQLQELTDDQTERLREWWHPQYGELVVSSDIWLNDKPQMYETVIGNKNELNGDYEDLGAGYGPHVEIYNLKKEEMFPLLSIGQMIELLLNEFEDAVFETHAKQWRVKTHKSDFISKHELADSLWEAVKVKLGVQQIRQ